MRDWETIEKTTAFTSKVLEVSNAMRRPRGADEPARPFVVIESGDWVNIVALTPKAEVVLIKQWRHGTGEVALEIPGGMVDPGETPAVAAARELEEETGYKARELVPLGWVSPNPALFTNRCHSFLAIESEITGPQRTEDTEDTEDTEEIEVLTAPLAQIPKLIRSGEINHSLVISAFHFLWLNPSLSRLDPAEFPPLGNCGQGD